MFSTHGDCYTNFAGLILHWEFNIFVLLHGMHKNKWITKQDKNISIVTMIINDSQYILFMLK